MAHAHHWIIESPDGRKSLPGRCKCGAEREFPSFTVDAAFDYGERGRARMGNTVVYARHTPPRLSDDLPDASA